MVSVMLLPSVKRHCAEKMYTKCHTRYVFRLYRVFLALSTVTHFGSASPEFLHILASSGAAGQTLAFANFESSIQKTHVAVFFNFMVLCGRSSDQDCCYICVLQSRSPECGQPRVRILFDGHPTLILSFNTFLPEGHQIEIKYGGEAAAESGYDNLK
jgi:hypothetical protein